MTGTDDLVGGAGNLDLPPSDEEWAALTVVPAKRAAYADDLYFREAWADARAVFGADAARALQGVAMLNAKPDAVVGRRLGRTLDFLTENGFVPTVTTTFEYTRHSIREIWRYDWNVYPVDRLLVSTFWYTTGVVPLFLLREKARASNLPATVRLSDLKGLADPSQRGDRHLRTALRPPNRILNFVHIADEPADVVREMGILVERPERLRLCRELACGFREQSDGTDAAWAVVADLENRFPAHDLDLRGALERLESWSPEAAAQMCSHLSCGRTLRWDELCGLVDPTDDRVERWDFIVLATSTLRPERPVPAAIMPPVRLEDWAARGAS